MRTRHGFTLVELLVVISIIGILIAIIQPTLSTSAAKGREFECASNLKQVGMALHAYSQDYGVFPAKLSRSTPLLDGRVIQCPGTSRDYWYGGAGESHAPDDVVAACVKPGTRKSLWPHRTHTSYLQLTAAGGLKKVH